MQETPTRVLVIDDDSAVVGFLKDVIARMGCDASFCSTAEDGIRRARSQDFDVALMDLNLPGMSGLDALRQFKAEGVDAEVVLITGEPSVDGAVEAMRLGAYDFVSKPIKLERLAQLIEKAAEKSRLRQENELLNRAVDHAHPVSEVVAESPRMVETMSLVERVAPTDAPVLITGETGAGKGLIAKALHGASLRSKQRFVHVDSGSLQEQLVESELFGHKKGAFTGAVEDKRGLFEVADRGTLFLDEVTELSLAMQSKLLQVLDSGDVRRVGGNTLRSVDARILAATNRDIRKAVKAGEFREDLFFRLSVVRVRVPPLRKRREDLEKLVETYLARFGRGRGRIEPQALEVLEAYSWPGNVRELGNTIQRALLLSTDGLIRVQDLPASVHRVSAADASRDSQPLPLREIEKLHIGDTLAYTKGNRTAAARLLAIDIKTLRKKIRDYGLGD